MLLQKAKILPWTVTVPEDRITCDRCGHDNSKGQFFVSCPKCNAKHVCIDCATDAEVDLGYCTEHLQAGIDDVMSKLRRLEQIVKADTSAFRSMLAVQTKPPAFRLGQLQGIAQTRLWARQALK